MMCQISSLVLFIITNLAVTASQHNYIYNGRTERMSDAEAFCLLFYGTHLASIHNDSQMAEAQSKCTANCWIGAQDSVKEGVFAWTDGTPFNYGATHKVHPWNPDEPNDESGEDCVEIRNLLWNDIPCTEYKAVLCNHPSPIKVVNDETNNIRYPISDHSIGTMDILDNIHIELDCIIYSYHNHSRTNILHIGSNITDLYPSIDLYGPSAELQITFSRFGNDDHINYTPIHLNTFYHITLDITQNTISVSVNDSTIYNRTNTSSHAILMQQPIYISNPWDVPIDGALRALKIITNNAYLNPFNYLCDFYNRFTMVNGNWTMNPSTCWLTQHSNAYESNIVWIGSTQWTDYKVQFVLNMACTMNSSSGLLFRTQSVTNALYLSITNTLYAPGYPYPETWLQLSKINGSITTNLCNCLLSECMFYEFDQYPITLRVEAIGDTFNIYWDTYLLLTYIDNSYMYGSVGLKTENTSQTFKKLEITFIDNNKLITAEPTSSPTQNPTTKPTRSPTKDPSIAPTYDTQSPTNNPSVEPTTLNPTKKLIVHIPQFSRTTIDPIISTNVSTLISSETSTDIMNSISTVTIVILSISICIIVVILCIISFGILLYRGYRYNQHKITQTNIESKAIEVPQLQYAESQSNEIEGHSQDIVPKVTPSAEAVVQVTDNGEGVKRGDMMVRMISNNPTLGGRRYSESSTISLKEDDEHDKTPGNLS